MSASSVDSAPLLTRDEALRRAQECFDEAHRYLEGVIGPGNMHPDPHPGVPHWIELGKGYLGLARSSSGE